MLKRFLQVSVLLLTLFGSLRLYYNKSVGDVIDNYNGVEVYFNNIPFTSKGESFSEDGYFYGKKYRSMEYVKRYYDEKLDHKIPEDISYGEEIFDESIKDGELNKKANLTQYSNPSNYPVKDGDILVLKRAFYDPKGHVAIVSKVQEDSIEIVQQNCWKTTRRELELEKTDNSWKIKNDRVLGRLQKN